ncbi:MAG TPA: hypothetical protein VGO07_04575 [Candidatus Saccharimonadales bacterium]|jgi:hypothetical protein|nr:hypothetical protein [Candidatus Saccharimonadales bacterium]
MKHRTATDGLRHHVGRLWDARLAISGAPDAPEASADQAAWPPEPADPLQQAAHIAAGLHDILELPHNGPRQPRAVLEVMAATALRRAE